MRRIIPALASTVILLLASTATQTQAATAPLAAYFPSSTAYPAGYEVLGVQAAHHPVRLFSGGDIRAAKLFHFKRGAYEDIYDSNGSSVTIIVARFRAARGAQAFRAHIVPQVYGPQAVRDEIATVGFSGARYAEGWNAPCDTTTRSELLFTRGRVFVEIGLQPANRAFAVQLALTIDAKIQNSSSA